MEISIYTRQYSRSTANDVLQEVRPRESKDFKTMSLVIISTLN